MRVTPEAALLRAAAAFLESLNRRPGPFVASATDSGGVEHRVKGHAWPAGPAAPRPRLRAILAQLPGYLTILDRRGRLRWTFRYEYGHTPGTAVGRPGEDFVFEADRPAWREAFERVVRLRQPQALVTRIKTAEPPGVTLCHHRLAAVVVGAKVRYVACVSWEEEPKPAPATDRAGGWRMFSDKEQAIINALRGKGAMTSEELARLLGKPLTNEMRARLRGLSERGVIDVTQREGVRLLE